MERMVCEMTENLSTIYRTIRIIPGISISAVLEASSSGSCTTVPKLAKSLRISRRPFVGSFSLPLSLLRVSGNFTQIKLFKTPPFGCGTDKWRKVLPASIWPAGRWGFGSDLARLASRASLACVFFWGSLCRSLCTPDSNLRIDGQSNIVSRSVCVCVLAFLRIRSFDCCPGYRDVTDRVLRDNEAFWKFIFPQVPFSCRLPHATTVRASHSFPRAHLTICCCVC